MRFEAVIFDLDGVLIRSEHINVAALVKTFYDLESPLSDEEARKIPGRSSCDLIPEFLKSRCVTKKERYDAIIETNLCNYDALWDKIVRLAPGAERVLRKLQARGIPLAIGTSNRRVVVERFVRRFGFEGVFQHIVSQDDVRNTKPDPEVYLKASDLLGISRERILVIEDTGIGLSAAKTAGLTCAVIPNEYSHNNDFSGADYILIALDDTLPLFVH